MRMRRARRRCRVRRGSKKCEGTVTKTWTFVMRAALLPVAPLGAQPGVLTKELLIKYTPEWKGERFADGRPKVPDGVLQRMKSVTLEEAWAQLRTAGFNHAFE